MKLIEIEFEEEAKEANPKKWGHPLKEDVFADLMSKAEDSRTVNRIFGLGLFFSPFLFGKFFDPSDAFPLWEFEAGEFLPNKHCVDWFQTDTDYVLKAEFSTGIHNNTTEICVENGKILEISGQWREQRDSKTREWKRSHWWEHGCVWRLELPEQTDWKRMEALVKNDAFVEIRIPKILPNCDHTPQ